MGCSPSKPPATPEFAPTSKKEVEQVQQYHSKPAKNNNQEKEASTMASNFDAMSVGDSVSHGGQNYCVVSNKYSSAKQLPAAKADEAKSCLRGRGHSKWPIHCYVNMGLNVNAYHGGGAVLTLLSCTYGGSKEAECTAELVLIRCGFSGNHCQHVSIKRNHHGHFGCENSFFIDEHGYYLPQLMFGNNDVTMMTNMSCYGDLSDGYLVESQEEECELGISVNGAANPEGENGGGNTLVLCGGWTAGAGDATYTAGLYMIRTSFTNNYQQAVHISGEDNWKFSVSGDEILTVSGADRNIYGIYHNREKNVAKSGKNARSFLTEAVNGTAETLLIENIPTAGNIVVLASNSAGAEDCTAAAVYNISFEGCDANPKVYLLKSSRGVLYPGDSDDLWKFTVSHGNLIATGPSGPCRYSFISNMPSTGQSHNQTGCLATGHKDALMSQVNVDKDGVTGWVSDRCEILIRLDKRGCAVIPSKDLKDAGDGKLAFSVDWRQEDKTIGLHLVQVLALRKQAEGEGMAEIELVGSPAQLIYQPTGVIYTLNCGGPAYEASNGIVYTSEHHQFASFTYDFNWGSRYTCFGEMLRAGPIPQLLSSTVDGQLYYTQRTSSIEPEDEQKIDYNIPDLPNGKFTLRLLMTSATFGTLRVNDQDIRSEVKKQTEKKTISGVTAMQVEVKVKITKNSLNIYVLDGALSAVALLSDKYKEPQQTKQEIEEDNKLRNQLIEKVEPVNRTFTRKKRKIVGWSPNLLQNASGEAGDMSHWDYSGDWKTHEPGYGTEKAFVTSHMRCTKRQEVDLTQHFGTDYLDTAPEIQVGEWYREGVCGGGFYQFCAELFDSNGEVLAKYETEETPRIYRNNKWEEAGTTFKNYGKGARSVSILSWGKDDKHWGGHYGPIISTSYIRAKRETTAAQDDSFEDILQEQEGDHKKQMTKCDQLAAKTLADNQAIIEELTDEKVIPVVDTNFNVQSRIESRKPAKTRKREIRVFVSSTFRDFKQEREALIKKTFREINQVCAERGVFFTYIDLRWGISEEQTNHGKTIAICLQEIERCPYFICMMGERFGWCQTEAKPDKLLDASFDYAIENFSTLKWIDKHRFNSSVTKLEVFHGVLNDVDTKRDRSFFYLRDSAREQDWTETDFKAVSAESDWHLGRQNELRNNVKSARELNIHQYRSPLDIRDLVKADLMKCLDADFPEGTQLTQLEREREAHQAFAAARQRVYIGGTEYFRQIDACMEAEHGQPLVVIGESGAGKSALIANWAGKVEAKEVNSFVFVHFIGSSAESAHYLKLLRRLFEELKASLGIELSVPTSDSHLARDLPVWLRMAGHRARCILILDALNQLDDGSGGDEAGAEHDLHWLPSHLPPNVNMVLSTLPGRAYDAVKSNGWPTVTVHPLQPDQKMEIVTEYMETLYGKTLSDDQKNMIVDAPQTNNPLYLKALLDEVRMYGNFRLLTQKIEEYLTADTPAFLFAKILDRLEEDFERGELGSEGVVKRTATAIWCSNRGMAEAELVELLQIPSASWSPFYLSLVENLVNRNGIVNFFHDHLRKAVETKYLSDSEAKRNGYLQLADFFSSREMDDRAAEELPWLLSQAGELERLKDTLTDLELFTRLVKEEDGKFVLIKAWMMLGEFSIVEEAYMGVLNKLSDEERSTEKLIHIQQQLADFFIDLGLYSPARFLLERLLEHKEKKFTDSHGSILYNPVNQTHIYRCTHEDVLELLQKLGIVCMKNKEFSESIKYYKEAISRQVRLGTSKQKLQLTEGLLGQATVLFQQSQMTDAKKFLIRARELATKVLGPRHHYVAAIINKLGQLAYGQGRTEEALGYFLQDLTLTRGDVGTAHPRTASILNDIALVYDDMNNPLAGELYQAALTILLDTYGNNHLDVAVTRYNLAAFFVATNYYARARYQLTEAHNVYQTFLGDDHEDTKEGANALQDVPN